MLSVVKMLLKGEVGGSALNSHGNYIVDHGKSWNCILEFLWEPCAKCHHSFDPCMIIVDCTRGSEETGYVPGNAEQVQEI